MATQKLTQRQQQVQKLLDEGKTPNEIAKALKISLNAVYQQRTRIRKAAGKRTRSAARTTGRKSRATKSRARTKPRPAATPAPAPTPAPAQRPMTPLQAIRARKSEIEHRTAESGREVDAARKALKAAEELHEKLVGQHAEELGRLEAAELNLTGKKVPKRSSNGSGSKSRGKAAARSARPAAPAAAKPPEEPLDPPTPDPEAEAELAAAQAASAATPVEEERPGVPVDPEFEQAEGGEAPALVGAEGEAEFEQADGFDA